MNILLMGYYGKRNVGDDLFVQQLTHYFSEKSAVHKIFVLCQEDYYPKISDKVQFFPENQLSKLKKVGLILQSDLIFWGGGTLNFGDRPTNLLVMQALSQFLGKKFGFLGVGLEGVTSENQKPNYEIFNKADILYFRDHASYQLFREKSPHHSWVLLRGDLAFLDLDLYQPFIKKDQPSSIQHISFSGKFWWGEGRGEFYAKQLMPVIEKYNCMIHLLPGHVGEKRNDNRFHEFLKKYLPPENWTVHNWDKPADFLSILSQMYFHLGNRLHSIILADLLGIPNIGIDKQDSKIGHYIDKTGLLSQERRVDFMEEISLERIETIRGQYRYPEVFIENESKQARQCLETLF